MMLGSDCSACCNVCGTDWTYASLVEVEIESVDYYSRWHGRSLGSEEANGVSRDYYFSFGFKGSAFSGTFQLTRSFISNQLAFFRNSRWGYQASAMPLCELVSPFPERLYGGVYATINFNPSTTSTPAAGNFELWPTGSSISYVSVGTESYTALDDMACPSNIGTDQLRRWTFGDGAPSHRVFCTSPVQKLSQGWQATGTSIEVTKSGHMQVSFSVLGKYATQFQWSGTTVGPDLYDWRNGFGEVVRAATPPAEIAVQKVSSTRAEDPQRLSGRGLFFPLSDIVKLKRVRVIL